MNLRPCAATSHQCFSVPLDQTSLIVRERRTRQLFRLRRGELDIHFLWDLSDFSRLQAFFRSFASAALRLLKTTVHLSCSQHGAALIAVEVQSRRPKSRQVKRGE